MFSFRSHPAEILRDSFTFSILLNDLLQIIWTCWTMFSVVTKREYQISASHFRHGFSLIMTSPIFFFFRCSQSVRKMWKRRKRNDAFILEKTTIVIWVICQHRKLDRDSYRSSIQCSWLSKVHWGQVSIGNIRKPYLQLASERFWRTKMLPSGWLSVYLQWPRSRFKRFAPRLLPQKTKVVGKL